MFIFFVLSDILGGTFLTILFVFMLLKKLPNDGTAFFPVALCII